MQATYREIRFSDDDVVNPEAYDSSGQYDKPYLIHDAGFTLAVVFARSEQDALDEAVDAGKLDHLQITEEDEDDYMTGRDSEGNPDYDERVTFLGNAGEPFDIETLEIIELPNPRFSFAALFAAQENKS
jgi:hypothetical protein